MHNIAKVIGPPGTGKTTYLLNLIEKACKKYGSNRVGAISFTKAAIEEMRLRAMKVLDIDNSKEISNIRTIHSHCWRLIGMKEDRLAEKHIKDFNKEYPQWSFNSKENKDDDVESSRHEHDNSKLFSDMNILRNRCMPIEKWPDDVKYFWQAWTDWKRENNLIDYTGILEDAYILGYVPDVDVLFVDEAQDLSALQLKLTNQWAENTVSTVYVGDSDQAIFKWAGAMPEVFRDLDCSWKKNLDQSYRLPLSIKNYALKFISQISKREHVEYRSTDKNGQGNVLHLKEPDLSLDGSHMILTRCNYQISKWIDWLKSRKLLWHNPYREEDYYWNPTRNKSYQALKTYYNLMDGKEVSTKSFKHMTEIVKVKDNLKRGSKKEIEDEVFDKNETIDMFDLPLYGYTDFFMDDSRSIFDKFSLKGNISEYLISNPDVFDINQPNIIVGTIHSVKGGEADHVWIDCSLPTVIYKNLNEVIDDEIRVFYVGMTRAKKTLGLLNYERNPIIM